MGVELLVFVFMMLALPFVAAGFALHYREEGQTKVRVEGAWEKIARARGFTFVPAEGEWPNVTSARLEWEEQDGTRARLEAVLREGAVCTRLSVRPRALLLGQALVSTSDKNRSLLRTATDDPTFDAVFFVRERPAGFAARVVSARVRRALLAFRMGRYAALRYRRGALSLVWEEGEVNPARIDEARGVLALAAAEVDSSFSAPRHELRAFLKSE